MLGFIQKGKKNILNQIKISSSNHGLSLSTPTEETSTREGAVETVWEAHLVKAKCVIIGW